MAAERFSLPEIEKSNPEMFKIITEHNNAIAEAIVGINKVTPANFQIETDYYFEILRSDNVDYKNDGNTQTKGYNWSAYWAFPLNGHKKSEYDIGSIRNQYCAESIIFILDDYHERCSDNRISGCKFFSLYFDYDYYADVVGLAERGSSKKTVRLDYLNNNYKPMAILKVENYAKIVLCMEKLQSAVNACNLFR